MKIPSDDIPQADELSDVLRGVVAVANGAHTYAAIAKSIGKVDRQGRYYRKAAQILGLITNRKNHAELTSLGRQYVEASGEDRRAIAVHVVMSARIFQRMLPFLEASHKVDGPTRLDIESFISDVTQRVGRTMIHRRVSTLISWLQETNVIRESRGHYSLTRSVSLTGPVEFSSIEEPLVPPSYELKDYETVTKRTRASQETIAVMVDRVRHERASIAHQHLVNCVAGCIRKVGSLPRYNQIVDLAATIGNSPFLFEMKSATEKNYHSQFRRAVSQLYEYRYLQKASTAKLVIIMENEPASADRWLIDYAISDRGILVAWNGSGNQLFTVSDCQKDLHFLV